MVLTCAALRLQAGALPNSQSPTPDQRSLSVITVYGGAGRTARPHPGKLSAGPAKVGDKTNYPPLLRHRRPAWAPSRDSDGAAWVPFCSLANQRSLATVRDRASSPLWTAPHANKRNL